MSFTSTIFIFCFFPLCIAGFHICAWLENRIGVLSRLRIKDLLLICMSLGFYLWGGMGLKGTAGIIVYMIMVYFFGCMISYYGSDRCSPSSNKKRAMALGVIILVSILFYCKYISFVTGVISDMFGMGHVIEAIWVPLGISFVTFSAISYIVDIYRGDGARGSLVDTFLYLILFTKVISGPIVLWKDFSPQIKCRKVDTDLFVSGLNRIMIGFAKKLILADYFGSVVMEIQTQVPNGIDAPTAWLCSILYTLQIYYDFAGYSDIAIGVSQLLGFRFKENFNFPYTSKSITEFWRRWHISLGTWFREYLYIPLGGNRKGSSRTLINLGVVFFVTGVWHGAGWNYIFWGCLHGTFMIIERLLKNNKLYNRIPDVIKWFATMFIVNFAWEAFRIQSITELAGFYKTMFGIGVPADLFFTWQYFLSAKVVILALIGCVGAVVLKWERLASAKRWLMETPAGFVIVEAVLIILMVIAVFCMVSSTYSPFIYFQY